jgi:hypothetical protein
MSRSFDELVTSTEHAQPVHPVKALFQNHFYLDDLVSTEGGMWILMTDALLLVPLVMAASSIRWRRWRCSAHCSW